METFDYIALLWCGSGARLSKVLEIKNFNNTETVSGTLTNTFGFFLADSFFFSFPKPLKPPSGIKTEQHNGPVYLRGLSRNVPLLRLPCEYGPLLSPPT